MNWINVKDKLPDEAGEKTKDPNKGWLVTDHTRRIRIETVHPSYWNKVQNEGPDAWCIYVSHWMPLPELPKNQ